MGRGCNRKTLKMRRKNSWRRHKLRLLRKIEEGQAAAGKKPGRAKPSATAVRRTADEAGQ